MEFLIIFFFLIFTILCNGQYANLTLTDFNRNLGFKKLKFKYWHLQFNVIYS